MRRALPIPPVRRSLHVMGMPVEAMIALRMEEERLAALDVLPT